jgi:hypothetical protein
MQSPNDALTAQEAGQPHCTSAVTAHFTGVSLILQVQLNVTQRAPELHCLQANLLCVVIDGFDADVENLIHVGHELGVVVSSNLV